MYTEFQPSYLAQLDKNKKKRRKNWASSSHYTDVEVCTDCSLLLVMMETTN